MTDTDLLGVLSRALIHVVRGDLSVITNDLAYFESLVPKEEVDRAKTRCANIAQFVGKLAILHDGAKPQPCALGVLLEAGLGSVRLDAETAEYEVCCDAQQMTFVLSTIAILTTPKDPTKPGRLVVEATGSGCTVVIAASRIEEGIGSYLTLSEFAMRTRGERAVVDAALCDLILRAHGWRCEVVVSDAGVEVSLEKRT